VIDAHAFEHAIIQPMEDALMCGIENVWALDTQSDQCIDVEEATVAEF